MFTGLIEDIGSVAKVESSGEGARLRIHTRLAGDLEPGDSIAVNGVCLTAAEVDRAGFAADAMNETLKVSSLGPLAPGDRVNLELAVRAGDRLGGHFVQGHVDGTAEVLEAEEDGFARRLRVGLDGELTKLVVERGSIALDGVSLTVSGLADGWVEVSLIPETLERTTLGEAEPGRRLNVECDLIGKYVQRSLAPLGQERKGTTWHEHPSP
ncbi:MAG TPA: riboflavin synthase [Solirubrobacterales bacterium]|nr:riboflavin synthase [Solirubrobacterales bacterium]